MSIYVKTLNIFSLMVYEEVIQIEGIMQAQNTEDLLPGFPNYLPQSEYHAQ